MLALFLLPDNLLKLRDKFAALTPGTRIVANTFGIEEWTADETIDDLRRLHELVHGPALFRAGESRRDLGDARRAPLMLKQQYQLVSGTFGTAAIENGRVRGDEVSFTAGGTPYTGRVTGDTMTGHAKAGGVETTWRATRAPK